MTDYSITITNSVLFVGYNPASTWGTMEWGTDNWRFEGGTVQDVNKPIDFGAVTLADTPIKDIEHLSDMGSTLLSDSTKKAVARGISNTLDMSYEISSAFLTDENGYNYVFIGDVIDADDRGSATWNVSSTSAGSWSLVSGASTVWS